MWGRVMVETATEVKISKTTKLKAVFDAFFEWIVYSVLGSCIPYVIFLILYQAYGKTTGNELVEFGSLVFSVVSQEIIGITKSKDAFKKLNACLIIGVLIFFACYIIVYYHSFTGLPLSPKAKVSFSFAITGWGWSCLILSAVLHILKEVTTV